MRYHALVRGLAVAAVAGLLLLAVMTASASEETYDYRPVLLDGQQVVEIVAGGEVLMRLRHPMDGMHAYERARIVVSRLNHQAQTGAPDAIRPGRINGHAVVENSGHVLATVHPETAATNFSTPDGLAKVWANQLRRALGAPALAAEDLQPATAAGEPAVVQVGIASWYGEKFHGRPTASGEIYDRWQMTAAHRTLPLGTRVRVTLQETGGSIVVRINDRGPFISGRIIDLSEQAALELGMWYDGIAEVEVEVLN